MNHVRIALATCSSLPDWEVDDRFLKEELTRRGVRFECPPWDEPGTPWESFDACLIRTTWDYMERRAEFVAWARHVASKTRLYNPPDIVEWNTHKSYLRRLEDAGVPVVPTIWLPAGQPADIARLVRPREWKKAIVKPAIGATAREALPFTANHEGLPAAQAHVDRLVETEDLMLQPFLSRVLAEGEESVIFVNNQPQHAVRKIPRPGDYRVQDDFGATDKPIELRPDLADAATRAVQAVGQDLLYARADFLKDDDGKLCLSELEVVEPLLFFRHAPQTAATLADALCERIRNDQP